jgi:2,4-dienoyl-CoA reductase (NADPH2)
MRRHETFHYRTPEALLAKACELGVALPFQDSIAPLLAPAALAVGHAPNRIAVQPMEGLDATHDGAPGDLTFRRYVRYAEGGNGLIWFEACSVAPAGRSNPRQLMLARDAKGEFARLVDRTRAAARARLGAAHNPYLVLQLTHSGRFSWKQAGARSKVACHNPFLEKFPEDVDLFSDDELSEIRNRFTAAALLAYQAGFDAVDVKACHGYLLHELLSAFTRADSAFGGTFENRSRMLLSTVAQVRAAVPGLAIAVRLNSTDGIPSPYGFGTGTTDSAGPDLSEPLRLQQLLIEAGCSLLNVTAGIPRYAPHMGRPYNRPARGGPPPGVHPLRSVVTLIDLAAALQRAQPGLPVVGTGYSWLRQFWPNVGAAVLARGGAAFIGLGRSSFAYPDAAIDLMTQGKLVPAKCCNACSCCTDLMRNHQITGCVLRDSALYKRPYVNLTK